MATGDPAYYGKATATLTSELREYDALAYEIEMFHEIAAWAVRVKPMGPTPLMESVLVEAFALHFRNLAEFLWPPDNKTGTRKIRTDVGAEHFARASTAWTAPPKPDGLSERLQQAGQQVAHLTTWRLSDDDTRKHWPFSVCIELLLTALDNFVLQADPDKRPPRVAPEVDKLRALMSTPTTRRVLDEFVGSTHSGARSLRVVQPGSLPSIPEQGRG